MVEVPPPPGPDGTKPLPEPTGNVDFNDLLSVRSNDIHLGTLSLEDLKKPVNKMRLKIEVLKWHPGLPGGNELINGMPFNEFQRKKSF